MSQRGKLDRGVLKMVDTESLVPQNHELRKIDAAVNWERLYEEPLYSEDNGLPSVDPVVQVKIVLVHHLYGLPSLRRTAEEVYLNTAYRWFLGYTLQDETAHFSTVSYNFRHRFTEETVNQIFGWILEEVADASHLSPQVAFIDATHIKASANTKKQIKAVIPASVRRYAQERMEEVNADREAHGKTPFEDEEESPAPLKKRQDNTPKRSWPAEKKGKKTRTVKECKQVFADGKEKHAMRYTQYRGLAQVTNWVKLKFVAMNLKKLAK